MWANIVQKIKQRFDRIKNHPFDFSVLTGDAKPLLIAVAITILSFLGVDIFYKIISLQVASRQTVGTRQTSAVAAFSGQGNSLERYNIITQRNLFLTTLKAIVDKNAGGNLLPSEEYTAFDLKGTIAVDQSMGYAIVEEKGKGKQKLYRIGETIGSARLIRITRNTAVLKRWRKRVRDEDQGSRRKPPDGTIFPGRQSHKRNCPQQAGCDAKSGRSEIHYEPGGCQAFLR